MDYLEIYSLYHHGVKGQKWGIRRYQNDDGSLTAEGKKRYGVESVSEMSKETLKQYQADRKAAAKEAIKDLKSKKLKVYSDIGSDYITDKYGNMTLADILNDRARTGARVQAGTAIVTALASLGVGVWLATHE